MPSLLKQLGISQEAALEHDLGIRFDDLTPQQRETWKQQTVYLGLYAEINNSTRAARAAGVTVRTVQTWQAQDTLGFNDRLRTGRPRIHRRARLHPPPAHTKARLLAITPDDVHPRPHARKIRRHSTRQHLALRPLRPSPRPQPRNTPRRPIPPRRHPPGNPTTQTLPLSRPGRPMPRTGYGGRGEGDNPSTPSALNPPTSQPRAILLPPRPGRETQAEGNNPSTPLPPVLGEGPWGRPTPQPRRQNLGLRVQTTQLPPPPALNPPALEGNPCG